jgi:hypothetical protein
MTQVEDCIGTLHVIAASDAPLDRQKEAVREVIACCGRLNKCSVANRTEYEVGSLT